MSVSMRLKRFGSKKRPYYRIVIVDSRSANSGKSIEEIGFYHPVEAENQVKINEEKAISWLEKGAQPSATVKALLNKQGIQVTRKSQE
ncbi:MAG: 30S ribosomal protein S16 [Sphaerochaetaceae bacterium]